MARTGMARQCSRKRAYPMRQTRDLTLEIAVNHIFSVYVDMPEYNLS